MQVHARDSEDLVKDINYSKFSVGGAECSLVRHRVFGCSKCLADEGRTPASVLAAFFLELTWTGVWTIPPRAY